MRSLGRLELQNCGVVGGSGSGAAGGGYLARLSLARRGDGPGFRLLVERERAHRAEHLARLTREPVVETAHSSLIFRERDGSLKPVAREHMEGPKRTYRPPARNKLLNRPVRERASPRRSASLSAAALRINWRFHSLCCALSIIASGERTWATTWPRPSGPSMCSLMQPSGHIPAPESAWAALLSPRPREHMNHSRTVP